MAKKTFKPDNINANQGSTGKLSTRFSVPFRLNTLNVLVLISGLFSVFGAYEIQLGGAMHNLNFLHAKNTHILSSQTNKFEKGDGSIESMRHTIKEVRQQPIDCLQMTSSVDRFVMRLIGTDGAIEVCQEDIKIADKTLAAIDEYEKGKIDREELVRALNVGTSGFFKSGQDFEPLVATTVKFVFLSVFIIILGKAVLVPIFGVYLSNGVARDYKILAKTKDRLEQEIARNNIIQAEKMVAMSTMVAGLAHEINTPLGITLTASSHLDEKLKVLENQYQGNNLSRQQISDFFTAANEASHIIGHNLKRSTELISSFKMVAVDQSIDESRSINLNDYLQDIMISLSPRIRRADHQVEIDCDKSMKIITYPGVLSQIITNLVTNSIDHAYGDGEQGLLKIEVVEQDSHIKLTYSDDGKGIASENISRVFDAFFTTSRGEGGSGLGLHIIYNLVTQKFGGTITCRNKLEKGAVFEIELPTISV